MSRRGEQRAIELPQVQNLGELPPDPYSRPPARQWLRSLVGVLLALSLFVLLVSLSLSNITAEGPAKRGLRQSVAVLTEVDAYLDARWEPLREQAAGSRPQAELTPPDFPVPVSFTAQEIVERDQAEFRALLLTRAAEQIYENGAAVFEGDGSDPSSLSLEGVVRNGLDFLRPDPHNALTLLVWASAIAAALLATALLLLGRGYARLVALGVTICAAAVPFLLFAIAARFALRVAADSLNDVTSGEFIMLAQELTWAPIRNGIIFSVGGILLLVIGIALTRLPALAGEREFA